MVNNVEKQTTKGQARMPNVRLIHAQKKTARRGGRAVFSGLARLATGWCTVLPRLARRVIGRGVAGVSNSRELEGLGELVPAAAGAARMRGGHRGPTIFQDQQVGFQLHFKGSEDIGIAVIFESIGSEESDDRVVGWLVHGGDAPIRVGSKGQASAEHYDGHWRRVQVRYRVNELADLNLLLGC
jgi:hypothetical protein